MITDQGEPRFLFEREAGIRAWYGEGLDETIIIALIPNTVTGTKAAAELRKRTLRWRLRTN